MLTILAPAVQQATTWTDVAMAAIMVAGTALAMWILCR